MPPTHVRCAALLALLCCLPAAGAQEAARGDVYPRAWFSAAAATNAYEMLQRVPERASVLEMNGVLWSDWGKPTRIMDSLRRIGREPAFPLDCLDRSTGRTSRMCGNRRTANRL